MWEIALFGLIFLGIAAVIWIVFALLIGIPKSHFDGYDGK